MAYLPERRLESLCSRILSGSCLKRSSRYLEDFVVKGSLPFHFLNGCRLKCKILHYFSCGWLLELLKSLGQPRFSSNGVNGRVIFPMSSK